MAYGFYADIVRGSKVALLAGPFPSEEAAREWAQPASWKAAEIDPRAHFDPFGVVGIEREILPVGKLNEILAVPAEAIGARP